MIRCHRCGEDVDLEGPPTRNDCCPACRSYLRCCANCRFHDRAAHNQCREPAAEWVADKEGANFCDYFQAGAGAGRRTPGRDVARDAFERLFRK